MNSFERFNLAINMKEVDRVPNAPFYEAPICKYFGESFSSALLNGDEMARTHLLALERYKFDWIVVGMGLIGGIMPEALGCKVTYPADVFPIIEGTSIQDISDVKRISEYNLLTPRMEGFLRGINLLKEQLENDVPIACEYISPFSLAARIRGVSQLMDDMYSNPDLVHAIQEALVPVDIEVGKALIEAGVDIIFYGADMECPLLISPQHYKEFVDGPTTQVVNELNRIGTIVLDHMCGDIVKTGIADMLMKMEIRGIMPGNLSQDIVLDIRKLKEKVKDRICIFDNINPNGNLLLGTPQEIDQEVKIHIEKAKGWKGYIFSTAGTMSPETPKDNFEAMNDAVIKYSLI